MYGNHVGDSLPDGIFHTRVRQEVDGADKTSVEVFLIYADVITKAVLLSSLVPPFERGFGRIGALLVKRNGSFMFPSLTRDPCRSTCWCAGGILSHYFHSERREGRQDLQFQIHLYPSVRPGPTSTSRSPLLQSWPLMDFQRWSRSLNHLWCSRGS
ncbi:hypothetical protein MHYP_G00000820 [Metynnis hypsauchen]